MMRAFLKLKNYLCLKNITNNNFSRNFKRTINSPPKITSALYIPGSRASETFSYFSPYLDFDERFENLSKTQEELRNRKINIDLTALSNGWNMYNTIVNKKNELERNYRVLVNKINALSNLDDRNKEQNEEYESLQIQSKINKNDTKSLNEAIWGLEEDIIARCLKIPNKLHEKTPVNTPVVLESVGEASSCSSKKSHIEIGTDLGLLEYKNNLHYFLFDKLALLEQGILNLAGDILKNNNFIRTTGLDFSRSSIVEGCGLDHENPMAVFILKNINDEKNALNPLNLTGPSSLLSFLVLFCKMKFNPNNLPITYFSTGRHYTPKMDNTELDGLFGVCQESIVQVFGITKNETECEELFQKIVDTGKQLYAKLCDNYRVVLRSAAELKASETLRISFEVWSNYKEQYIEAGYVAMHGDYFSKRLLIVYQTPSGRNFPQIVTGQLISVPKLLGHILEKDSEKFQISENIQKYIPTK